MAFRDFFDVHYPVMVSFAMNYVSDQDQAEELVQDVFANVWSKAATLKLQASPRAYLFSSTRYACLNFLKHKKVEQAYLEQSTFHQDQGDPVEYDELVGRLERALDKVPEKCREIFEMNRFQGKRYKEIAEELGLSLRTVENQMGKALKVLRQELGDYLPIILWLWWHGGKF